MLLRLIFGLFILSSLLPSAGAIQNSYNPSADAFVCDNQLQPQSVEQSRVPFRLGSKIRICVQPTVDTSNQNIMMGSIDRFSFSKGDRGQDGVQEVINSGVPMNQTSISCKPGAAVCSFITLLSDVFFYPPNVPGSNQELTPINTVIQGVGAVTMVYVPAGGTGGRRYLRANVELVERRIQCSTIVAGKATIQVSNIPIAEQAKGSASGKGHAGKAAGHWQQVPSWVHIVTFCGIAVMVLLCGCFVGFWVWSVQESWMPSREKPKHQKNQDPETYDGRSDENSKQSNYIEHASLSDHDRAEGGEESDAFGSGESAFPRSTSPSPRRRAWSSEDASLREDDESEEESLPLGPPHGRRPMDGRRGSAGNPKRKPVHRAYSHSPTRPSSGKQFPNASSHGRRTKYPNDEDTIATSSSSSHPHSSLPGSSHGPRRKLSQTTPQRSIGVEAQQTDDEEELECSAAPIQKIAPVRPGRRGTSSQSPTRPSIENHVPNASSHGSQHSSSRHHSSLPGSSHGPRRKLSQTTPQRSRAVEDQQTGDEEERESSAAPIQKIAPVRSGRRGTSSQSPTRPSDENHFTNASSHGSRPGRFTNDTDKSNLTKHFPNTSSHEYRPQKATIDADRSAHSTRSQSNHGQGPGGSGPQRVKNEADRPTPAKHLPYSSSHGNRPQKLKNDVDRSAHSTRSQSNHGLGPGGAAPRRRVSAAPRRTKSMDGNSQFDEVEADPLPSVPRRTNSAATPKQKTISRTKSLPPVIPGTDGTESSNASSHGNRAHNLQERKMAKNTADETQASDSTSPDGTDPDNALSWLLARTMDNTGHSLASSVETANETNERTRRRKKKSALVSGADQTSPSGGVGKSWAQVDKGQSDDGEEETFVQLEGATVPKTAKNKNKRRSKMSAEDRNSHHSEHSSLYSDDDASFA